MTRLRRLRPSQLPQPAAAALVVLTFVLLAVVPPALASQFYLQVGTVALLNAALAASLVVSLGYAGVLNLSQGTFYGLGAYTTAALVTDWGVPLELAALAAATVAAAGGVVLGLVSVRIRGDYFALASLAFTVALFEVMQNWRDVTRGREGFFGIPTQSVFGLEISTFEQGYYLALALLAVIFLLVWRFGRTFASRALLAIRYDEAAARAAGIDVAYSKILAMGLSAGLAGLAGTVLVATLLFIRPEDFDLLASFTIMLWVIIGGMASLTGATAVAGVVAVVTEGFRQLSDYRVGILGALVLFAVYLRGGVLRSLVASRFNRRLTPRAQLESE